MKYRTVTARLAAALLALALLIVQSAAATAPASAQTPPTGGRLGKHDRELYLAALARGESQVTLLIASQPGANPTVVAGLARLGGILRYRDDGVGYIRARVPASQVPSVARLAGVQAVNLDEVIPLDDPRPDADGSGPAVDPPGSGTAVLNPYMPTRDIGAPQFVAANPTYDGRGVKIGIVDLGVDLLTPELQTAKTLDGKPTRKIVDWVTFTDPFDDDDPTWIDMKDQVSGATFSYKGTTYTAPAAGTYRIGIFDERDPRLGGELGNDVNRDGNPEGSKGTFAVLWDAPNDRVWVDTNQNNSFADQAAMTNYRTKFDVGTFGTDNPATALRETVPFVVQTDGQNKAVNIGIVSGRHGTHVAGIAAGKGFFGGAFNGAAPEAQIVSVRACLFIAGCTSHAMIEGTIFVAKQANVDVINMSIGGLPAINDGNNTFAVIYNRLIDQTKAQMFVSAGNSGPGINTVNDPSVASKVMSVGAYVHKDTWLSNYGATATKTDGLFVFSSRGPREDGGFKPNIVAPGSAVSSIPGWQAGNPLPGTYALPPGYGMLNGTSMAAPQATGGAALLISAAMQTGAQWRPEQLRQAIGSTARYLPAYGAHEQGNGLFQVAAAWDLLKRNIRTVEITSSAPVKTILSPLLATANRGLGIYEREGWTAGTSAPRTITFTRTSGGAGASFNLSWVGNDGTFSGGGGSVSLPLNSAVNLSLTVSPATAGVHSAILNLDDPATPGVDYQVLNTVVATAQFTAGGNYAITHSGSADRPDKAAFFFPVAPNAPAFKVDLTDVSGRVRLLRFSPYGVPFDNTSTTSYQNGGTQTRTLTAPNGGAWEATVDTSRTSSVSPATFSITGTLLGASVSPNPDTIPTATVGVPISRSYTIANQYGPFTGRAAGTPLGSARRGTFTIADQQKQEYTFDVPAGATSLRATIGSPSDPRADLDLFVYNCTTGTCVLADQSADYDSEESVTVSNPAAGKWTVVVDGYAVPAGSTTYSYVDVFVTPTLGSISVTDADALRPVGAVWTVPATVTASTAPTAGRILLGSVQIRTDANAVIGQNEVIVQAAGP